MFLCFETLYFFVMSTSESSDSDSDAGGYVVRRINPNPAAEVGGDNNNNGDDEVDPPGEEPERKTRSKFEFILVLSGLTWDEVLTWKMVNTSNCGSVLNQSNQVRSDGLTIRCCYQCGFHKEAKCFWRFEVIEEVNLGKDEVEFRPGTNVKLKEWRANRPKGHPASTYTINEGTVPHSDHNELFGVDENPATRKLTKKAKICLKEFAENPPKGQLKGKKAIVCAAGSKGFDFSTDVQKGKANGYLDRLVKKENKKDLLLLSDGVDGALNKSKLLSTYAGLNNVSKKYCSSKFSVKEGGKIPVDPHQEFLVASANWDHHVEEVGLLKKFVYVCSTVHLLLNSYRQSMQSDKPILQIMMDATFRVNREGFCHLVMGTVDVNQHLHIIAYAIVSNDDEDCHDKFVYIVSNFTELILKNRQEEQEKI